MNDTEKLNALLHYMEGLFNGHTFTTTIDIVAYHKFVDENIKK